MIINNDCVTYMKTMKDSSIDIFEFIGIEKEKEYFDIAERRINNV